MQGESLPEKITLTQIRRYLPIVAPPANHTYPLAISRFLSSSVFSNLSSIEQRLILHNYQVAYRDYFPLDIVVSHIHQHTLHKYTRKSIAQAVSNAAMKHDIIDWYKIIRMVYAPTRRTNTTFTKQSAASFIIRAFRKYRHKKRKFNNMKEVAEIARSLEPPLLAQFTKQAYLTLKQFSEANGVLVQTVLSQMSPHQLSLSSLEQVVNGQFHLVMDRKKLIYLYLKYDPKNIGKFSRESFIESLQTAKKQNKVKLVKSYLCDVEEILDSIRQNMKSVYICAQDLRDEFMGWRESVAEEQKFTCGSLQEFINGRCGGIYSTHHIQQVYDRIGYIQNLNWLFNKPLPLDMERILQELTKMMQKKKKKRILKEQNPVFYQFRTIILLLITKCKSKKIRRQEFAAAITSQNPHLPYNSFYCVWRVYGELINLERMRHESKLGFFACILRLKFTPEVIDRTYQSLMEEYPQNTSIMYIKVEEKINLMLNFILDTLGIRAHPNYNDYEIVPYHAIIDEIFQPDFELMIRAYIFSKVASKTVGLWKARKAKKKYLFEKLRKLQMLSLTMPPKKNQTLGRSKSNSTTKRLISDKSNVSLKTKVEQSLKVINPQTLDIVRYNLRRLLQELPLKQKFIPNVLNRQGSTKKYVSANKSEEYSYRTLLPKSCYNLICGRIGYGQEVVFMKDNHMKRIQLRIPYRPSLQIIDLQVVGHTLLLLTSYLTLQIYHLSQDSNYPQSTIQLSSSTLITNAKIDSICKNRLYGIFPKLITKSNNNILIANTVLADNQLSIMKGNKLFHHLTITQEEHQFPQPFRRLMNMLKGYPNSEKLNCHTKFIELMNGRFQQFQKWIDNQSLQLKFSLYDFNQLKQFSCKVKTVKLQCVIKEFIGIYKIQKVMIPGSLKAVSERLVVYMNDNNMSIWDLIQEINKSDKNMLLLKNLKDYLLKMTQELYIINAVEIESYLKKIAVGKELSYDVMINVMSQWKYPIWQRPHTILNQAIYSEDYQLLIYTIQSQNNIYIRNCNDSKIVGVLQSHECTPIISYISNRSLIVSGDTRINSAACIKVWRLHDDLLSRYFQVPPWTIEPFITFSNAHLNAITAIVYLPRSHLIVTGSLDSTVKMWSIVEDKNGYTMKEEKKIYSSSHYMIHLQNSISTHNSFNLETLTLGKIGKQINDNNKYKYEMTVQVYHVENMQIKVAQKSMFENIPLKMEKYLEQHSDTIFSKKTRAINSMIVQQQQKIRKAMFIRQNIQEYLYSSIKKYYIYSNTTPLSLIIKYLKAMPQGHQMFHEVIQTVGLKIMNRPQIQITEEQKLENILISNSIQKQQPQRFFIRNTIQTQQKQFPKWNYFNRGSHSNNSSLYITKSTIVIIFDSHFQKQQFTNVNQIINMIVPYPQNSQISKLYFYLRQIQIKLKQKGFKMWQLFANEKIQLLKIKKISMKQFQNQLSKIDVNESIIQFITPYLSRDQSIYFEDLIYYIRLAWQQVNIYINNQNLSEVFMSNSKLLQSRFIINQNLFQVANFISKEPSKSAEKKNMSSSSHLISDSSKPKLYLEKIKSNQQKDEGVRSRVFSSSNSFVTHSRQSYTKDSFTRSVGEIIKRFRQLLKNQGKSFWDLISLTVVDFLENDYISQTEYYGMFTIISTPFKLKDKIDLLRYIRRESEGKIDLNLLFDLSDLYQKGKVFGERHVISFIVRRISEFNLTIEQALEKYIFRQKQQVSIEEIVMSISADPFFMRQFGLKEIELILINQNKSGFTLDEIKSIIETLAYKHSINIETKKITFIDQILFKIEKRGETLDTLFPKVQPYNFELFFTHSTKINPQLLKDSLISDFLLIVIEIKSNKKISSKNIETCLIKHKDFINSLSKIVENNKNSLDDVKNNAKRLVKNLQSKRIGLLSFFSSLDKGRNFFITQLQLQAGLIELDITTNIWSFVKKKNPKKLYFAELIDFLILQQAVNYKCIDSQLQIAIDRFIKRFLRKQDIQVVFDRMKSKNSQCPNEVTFESFKATLSMTSLFKEEQLFYLFSAFVNSDKIRKSKFSNDQVIKDSTNTKKIFNFKMFTDVLNHFKSQKITTTPAYKFCQFAKKRNISLLNEFSKFMDRNKRNKDVAEAIKKKNYIIPQAVFVQWLEQLKAGLNQKEMKQLCNSLSDPVDFMSFHSRLQQLYKKANSNIQIQEINLNLQLIIQKAQKQNVSIQRLYNDYASERNKMTFKDLTQLTLFLGTGLNKIQLKYLYNFIDNQKKGYITYLQFQDAMREAGTDIQKDQQDYQLQYIIQKLINNKQKYILRNSKLSLTLDRMVIIFSKILSQSETAILYKNVFTSQTKNQYKTQKEIENYIQKKGGQIKSKKDKKYKELIIHLLKYLKRINVDVTEVYNYFSKDTNSLNKNKFITLYQSLDGKASIVEINALYSYLDQENTGKILKKNWDQKLSIVFYQQERNWSSEGLNIFYKVKIFLSQLYLCFIRKMFKRPQIYSFFDKNSTGKISYQEFWNSIDELGLQVEAELQKKVLNYLDRGRDKNININVILIEMEQSLGSKNKLILETKTSCIFKSRQQYFAQKADYLIDRIVTSESFQKNNDGFWQSVILETDFISIIHDFGAYLHEDQVQDVRKNFQFNSLYLRLYPIYFMLVNLFKQLAVSNKEESQKLRYQKILKTFVKKNITFSDIQKLKSVSLMQQFLSQLKVFTPIEVNMIMEAITIPQTTAVDLIYFKNQILNSYLNDSKIHFGSQTNMNLKKYFKDCLINKDKFRQQISKGKINLSQFVNILVNINCKITKGQAEGYFDLFSEDKELIDVQDIIKQDNSNNVQKQQLQAKVKRQQQENILNIMLNHIQKSLNFKDNSLLEALEAYYELNYGEITQANFIIFLKSIGYNIKEQKKFNENVKIFLREYYKHYPILYAKSLQEFLIVKNHTPKILSNSIFYKIESSVISKLSSIFEENLFSDQLQKWMANNEIGVIYKHKLYQFMKMKLGDIDQDCIKFICHLVPKSSIKKSEIIQAISNLIKSQKSSNSLAKKAEKQSQVEISPQIVQQKNFIKGYEQKIKNFRKVNQIPMNHIGNLRRLSHLLVLEQFLNKPYLLRIQPYFINGALSQSIKPLTFHQFTSSFIVLPINAVLEKEKYLPSTNLTLINEKYIGLTDKSAFQTMAIVNCLFNPQVKFYRIKNYYCWQPNQHILPSGAIKYRWKYIPMVIKEVLSLITIAHQHGYCLPHLRWSQLSHKSIIHHALYPCSIDINGRIKNVVHPQLLTEDDPYCAPQMLIRNAPKDTISLKCDSWIFGCILYEFIFGHPPSNFHQQLREYFNMRQVQILQGVPITEQFQQLPIQFHYKFWNEQKVRKLFSFEHQLQIINKKTQTMSFKQNLISHQKDSQSNYKL